LFDLVYILEQQLSTLLYSVTKINYITSLQNITSYITFKKSYHMKHDNTFMLWYWRSTIYFKTNFKSGILLFM